MKECWLANWKVQNKPKQRNRSSANQTKAKSIWLQRHIQLPFAVEARIPSAASPCGFYVNKVATRRDFLQMFRICPLSIILPMPHTHILIVYYLSNWSHLHFLIEPNTVININRVTSRHKPTKRKYERYMTFCLKRRYVIARVTYVCRHDSCHISAVSVA